MDTVVAGLVVLGFTAFGWNLGRRLGKLPVQFRAPAAAAGDDGLEPRRADGEADRALGVMGGYYEVYRAVRVWSKELLTRFGERVLEVRPRPA